MTNNSTEPVIDWQYVKDEVSDKWYDFLMIRAFLDPLENYIREQDHFLKYVDPAEAQAWIDHNKEVKQRNQNKFASTYKDPNFRLRDLIDAPAYIIDVLELKHPGYFDRTAAGLKRARAFAKRNPLFCNAEVV